MKRVRSFAMAMTLLMALSLMGCGAAGGEKGQSSTGKSAVSESEEKQDQEILLS